MLHPESRFSASSLRWSHGHVVTVLLVLILNGSWLTLAHGYGSQDPLHPVLGTHPLGQRFHPRYPKMTGHVSAFLPVFRGRMREGSIVVVVFCLNALLL